MCDSQWEPLAEIYLSHPQSKNSGQFTFCLCSRVFIKNHTCLLALEHEEFNEIDDLFNEKEYNNHMYAAAVNTSRVVKTLESEENIQDVDANSCYHSASASHTDNYYSTDEHEPTIPHISLNSSDSGADISEYQIARKYSDISKRAQEISQFLERNNSLPDAFGAEELNHRWEKYWSNNGERLIWSSWIEKYSDYINPDYKKLAAPNAEEETPRNTEPAEGTKFTFDPETIDQVDSAANNVETEIIVSSCSPAANSNDIIADGWKPLPPSSNDDTWTLHRNPSQDIDSLLSPRCESVTSSIPFTIGTTDSMTNVTHMTISSYDFGSSRVSSESSQLTDSSAETSSDTPSSTSQLLDLGEESKHALLNEEDAMDSDQHWHILWQKHFQEQYASHYNIFMETHRKAGSYDLSASFQNDSSALPVNNEPTQVKSRFSKKKKNRKAISENLPNLVHNLNLQSNAMAERGNLLAQMEPSKEDGDGGDGGDCDGGVGGGGGGGGSCSGGGDGIDCELYDTENMALLASFGLPTAFGKCKDASKSIGVKRSGDSDSEESSTNRIKRAFSLMGFSYDDQENFNNSFGEVIYRKKHIRLHNRILKMKHFKPNHIHFDEYGNEIKEHEPETIQAILHSSSDEDFHLAPVPRQSTGGQTSNQNISEKLEQNVNKTKEDEYVSIENDEPMEAIGGGAAAVKDQPKSELDCGDQTMYEYGEPSSVSSKRERKRRRKNKVLAASLPAEILNDKTLLKYWYKRFSLFSLFDMGIKLDRESWFSVSPEKVAAYTAQRCKCDIVIDAFCGAGGNTIQFALNSSKVIAIDIDPKKVEMAKHNANVYGVASRIEFIIGDYLKLCDSLKGDIVFLSPPWGGPQYIKDEVYDLERSLLPVPASTLLSLTRKITPNIAVFLPRNTNTHQLAQLAGEGNAVEIEQSFLDRKLIGITAYYGNLLNK